MSASTSKRRIRHQRLRKKVAGTPERPRLAVHFSERHISAQVIDDTAGKTLASVHTTEPELRSDKKTRSMSRQRRRLGSSSPNAALRSR